MATDPNMDPLDDSLKRAMKALDDQVSDRYFEELPNRTLARLEEMMQSDVNRPTSGPQPIAASASSPRDGEPRSPAPPKKVERVEDSGLHDIRALASTTKSRVSKKRLTENPPFDDAFLHTSSASLRAVALPEPSKMVQTGEHDRLADAGSGPTASLLASATGTAAAEVATAASPITPLAQRKKSKAPVVVGTLVAAAAGVAGFVLIKQNEDNATSEPSAALMHASDKEAADEGTRSLQALPPAAAPAPARAAAAGAAMEIAADPGAAPGDTATGGRAEDDADGKLESERKDRKGDGKDRDKVKDRPDQKLDGKGKDKDKDETKGGKPVSDATDVKKDDKQGDKQGESLDDLLREAGVDPTVQKKVEGPKTDKKSLDAGDIRKAMSALNGKAQACYAKFGVSGSVAVKLTVAPSGEIKKAVVTGAAAGTPTGDCVAEVVTHAKFPIWDGAPQTVTYSYFLSE